MKVAQSIATKSVAEKMEEQLAAYRVWLAPNGEVRVTPNEYVPPGWVDLGPPSVPRPNVDVTRCRAIALHAIDTALEDFRGEGEILVGEDRSRPYDPFADDLDVYVWVSDHGEIEVTWDDDTQPPRGWGSHTMVRVALETPEDDVLDRLEEAYLL